MRKFRETVKEFEYYINIEKNFSTKTSRTYLKNLCDFENYLIDSCKIDPNVFEITQITKDNLKNYIMYLKINRGNKATTINTKISTLKSFYSFLSFKGYIENNIANDIRHQKLPKLLPMYLTYDESESLLLGTKLLSNNPTRDYALMCTYLLTGARLSEIVYLKIDQISFSSKAITLMGKGAKERSVPMVDRVEKALREYLNINTEGVVFKPRNPSIDTSYVFLNKYGRPISENGMQELVISLMKKTGVYKKGLSTHKLRHTCFTLLHRSGIDLLRIQRIAGHESIKSTSIYTHLDEKDLYSSMQKNPLNANDYANEFITKIKKNFVTR
ncbi:tyrosine-type recombinase/integrase [Ruminiclostridium cellobioparum]|uniref:tyrosine-type recombinase/integrase n=1 Tax=Ruminiclostridium cellobioparum TaxID=29355 RepID=UPI0028AFFDE6|nr:tyrosine-type recombinase/integrase [Ruminiclostridium cellobioparum]